MIGMNHYILQGLCDGNCCHCILPCEDRDKPIMCYTPKKIQDESDDMIYPFQLDSAIDEFIKKEIVL